MARLPTALVGVTLLATFLFVHALATAGPARAFATTCQVSVNGRNTNTAVDPANAITLSGTEPARLRVTANRVIESASIAILVGPMPVFSQVINAQGQSQWSGSFSVAEYATWGSGLYQGAATIDGCPVVQAWFRIESQGPTVATFAGLAVGAVGVATASAGLASSARGRGGLGRSIVGGAALGVGALVVGQQAGVVVPDAPNLLGWTAVPGAAGGFVNTVVGAAATRRRRTTVDRGGAYRLPSEASGGAASYQPPWGPAAPLDGPAPMPTPMSTGTTASEPPGWAGAAPPMSTATTASEPPGWAGAAPPAYVPPPAPEAALPPAYVPPSAPDAALPPPIEAAPTVPHEATPAAPVPAQPSPSGAAAGEPPRTRRMRGGPSRSSTTPGEAAAASAGGTAGSPTTAGAAEERGAPESSTDTASATPDSTGVAAPGQPPRSSYAHIDCPEAVVAEVEFELVVGLGREPDSDVVGSPLVVPERVIGAYTMTIQVIADGFHLSRPGESWRVDLPVTGELPYPTGVLHLAADGQTRPVVARTVRAMYSIDGQAVGLAARPIAVAREASLLVTSEPPAATEPVDMAFPTDQMPPDLTVRVEVSQPAGRLILQLLAADPAVTVADDPLVVDIGNEPDLFLRSIIRKMNAAEGQPGMYQILMGIGLTISEQLPTEFWDAIAAVAARTPDRPPTILFLSGEPYVPWELAVMETPLDPALPPFLAAQASVGRWVLGQRRPKLPPPSHLDVKSIAVVSGIYSMPGWDRLLDAEQEATQLATIYGAQKVDASSQGVRRLVSGDPPADLLHFAVHGQYDPNGEIDGIVLVDGLTLDPMQVRGSPLSARPFVFLNACQVGSGEAVLGDYAGMAEAFLFAGASGVIAPLWSIDDVVAREIALRFYEKALTGRSPADILREERAAFRDDPGASSTYLAYQYFGHPHMTIARPTA